MRHVVRARSIDEALARWAGAGVDVALLRARELTLLSHVVDYQERVWADGRGRTKDLPEHLVRVAPLGNDVEVHHRVVRMADLVAERHPRELVQAFFAPCGEADTLDVIAFTSPRIEALVDSRGPGFTSLLQRRPFAMLVEGDPPYVPLPAGREVAQKRR